MPRVAGPPLQQCANHGKTSLIRKIDVGRQASHGFAIDQLRIDAVEPHAVAQTRMAFHLPLGVRKEQCPPLAEHDIKIQILAQGLPKTD